MTTLIKIVKIMNNSLYTTEIQSGRYTIKSFHDKRDQFVSSDGELSSFPFEENTPYMGEAMLDLSDVPTTKGWWQENTYDIPIYTDVVDGYQHLNVDGRLGYVYSIPENMTQLNDGHWLLRHFGKYKSAICIILSTPMLQWNVASRSDFNLPNGDISCLIGDFWISKKGNPVFKVKPDGSCILIKDEWGGCFNSYRGNTLPEKGSLYYHRASSNGGGAGVDYGVYPRDWKFLLSEDDL